MKWHDIHKDDLFTVKSTQFSRERFNALLGTMNPESLDDYAYGEHLRIDTAEWFYKHSPHLKEAENVASEVKANHRVISQLTNVSEMRQLKARTVSNRYASLVATKHLEEAVEKMPDNVKDAIKKQQDASRDRVEKEKRLDTLKHLAEETGNEEELEEEINEREGEFLVATKKESEAMEELEGEMEISGDDVRSSLRSGCADATEQLEKEENLNKVFSGNAGGGSGGSVTPEDMMEVAEYADANKELHHIATVAGRLQQIARATTQTNAERHTGEITDTTLGKRLANLTGSEKAKLAHPIARKQVMGRLLDNRAMSWKKEDREELGKGGIILAVDNSGSMDGDRNEPLKRPIIWAKGVALALYRVCAERGTPFHYLHWGGSQFEMDGQTFTGKRGEERELMEHSLTFFCGGNDLPSTWEYLEERLAEPLWKKADVITITDAIEDVYEKDYAGFLEACEKNEASSYGIYLNDNDHYLKEIEKYCSKVWLCRPSGSDHVLKELVHDLTKTT